MIPWQLIFICPAGVETVEGLETELGEPGGREQSRPGAPFPLEDLVAKKKTKLNPFLDFIYRRGFRLASLAKTADIPKGTLGAISAGNLEISPENRRKLARALGCRKADIPDPSKVSA